MVSEMFFCCFGMFWIIFEILDSLWYLRWNLYKVLASCSGVSSVSSAWHRRLGFRKVWAPRRYNALSTVHPLFFAFEKAWLKFFEYLWYFLNVCVYHCLFVPKLPCSHKSSNITTGGKTRQVPNTPMYFLSSLAFYVASHERQEPCSLRAGSSALSDGPRLLCQISRGISNQVQISTVNTQGVHIKHYMFLLCSTWTLEIAGWCELEWMDVFERRAATSSCTEKLSYGRSAGNFPFKICFGLQSLSAVGLLWSKHICAPHFLAESQTARDLRLCNMSSTQITSDNSVAECNRCWQTIADRNGRSLLFPS